MAADVISGEGGAVNGEECVRLWKLARISKPAMGVCSASDGAVLRAAGISDWQGVYTGYGHTPSVLPGTKFQFIGATRESKGATAIASGAIMERTQIKWSIEAGGFIEFANYFACCEGAITFGAASASDSSTPDPSIARSCTINLTGCEELREMEMNLISRNPSYVTATTDGRRERDVGNKDGNFRCKIYTKDASFPAESAVEEVEFGVGDGLKWIMKWAIVTLTAPLLQIEEGMFEADLAGEFTGYYNGAKGNVTSPAGVNWWP
ncbi:MAG: hypothetical protein U9Q82_11255 [Chloroflexota bacterium]|nr:hypothetical protein [Chloroflexota bacterium]